MSDVFDEELIKELGLDPGEFASSDKDKEAKKNKPSAQTAPAQKVEKQAEKPAVSAKSLAGSKPPSVNPDEAKSSMPMMADDLAEYGKNLTQDIPVQLVAVLAKKTLALKSILEMKTGEILEFKKMPQDPMDLVVNGKLVAKAELVLVDGRVGARIVKLIK